MSRLRPGQWVASRVAVVNAHGRTIPAVAHFSLGTFRGFVQSTCGYRESTSALGLPSDLRPATDNDPRCPDCVEAERERARWRAEHEASRARRERKGTGTPLYRTLAEYRSTVHRAPIVIDNDTAAAHTDRDADGDAQLLLSVPPDELLGQALDLLGVAWEQARQRQGGQA